MPHDLDEAAKKHLTQGMTPADMEATLRVANKRNEIIIFRSTGPWPRKYIETGECPTKDMGVKGKSSTWGPMAGLIPVDSMLSKAMKPEDVKSGRENNKKSLAGGKVVAAQLTLSEEMITRLLTEKLQDDKSGAPRTAISSTKKPDNDPLRIYLFAEKRDGKEVGSPKDHAFFGSRITNKEPYKIFYFPDDANAFKTLMTGDKTTREALEKEGTPLEVLTRPGKPFFMTGDYDLFAICPAWADFGPKDKRSDNFMDDPKYAKRMKQYQNEIDPTEVKDFETAFAAVEAIAEKRQDATKYKGFLKGKVNIDAQLKGKETALKAGQESMKIVCSGGCVDPDFDNDPLEFLPDDESCRKCKKPAMIWLNCIKGCKGEVKDKAGKPKPYVFQPADQACPKCGGGPVSAARSKRDFEDGSTVGNVTFRVLEVIAALNKEMGATDFNKRVHHNQEAGRFHAPADIAEAFPLTVVQPQKQGLKDCGLTFKFGIIDDIDDLKAYFLQIFAIGYYVPLNHAWEIKTLNETLLRIEEGEALKKK